MMPPLLAQQDPFAHPGADPSRNSRATPMLRTSQTLLVDYPCGLGSCSTLRILHSEPNFSLFKHALQLKRRSCHDGNELKPATNSSNELYASTGRIGSGKTDRHPHSLHRGHPVSQTDGGSPIHLLWGTPSATPCGSLSPKVPMEAQPCRHSAGEGRAGW
jgi:hypothetical protein